MAISPRERRVYEREYHPDIARNAPDREVHGCGSGFIYARISEVASESVRMCEAECHAAGSRRPAAGSLPLPEPAAFIHEAFEGLFLGNRRLILRH